MRRTELVREAGEGYEIVGEGEQLGKIMTELEMRDRK
jgi:hypothetical protein